MAIADPKADLALAKAFTLRCLEHFGLEHRPEDTLVDQVKRLADALQHANNQLDLIVGRHN